MASLSLTTAAEERGFTASAAVGAPQAHALTVVVALGDPVAADYAAHLCRSKSDVVLVADADLKVNARVRHLPISAFSGAALGLAGDGRGVESVVLFLGRRLTDRERAALDESLAGAAREHTKFVAIVSSFGAHLGDRDPAEVEALAAVRAKGLHARTVLFRVGHVLSPASATTARLRRFAPLFPLVPRRLRSCFVEAGELFAAIEAERHSGRSRRLCTILGPNLSWRDVLVRHRPKGFRSACLTVVSALLSMLLVGHVAALILDFMARRRPHLKRWNFDTLRPRSLGELLALCNRHNRAYVKVVGYNNGVIHFGHRYPGKTVVCTALCNRVFRMSDNVIRADCGATIRKALDFLAGAGQELFVVPNYSYVCLGTAFFVPIHGSASDFSTVAETITKVILYDPSLDRIVAATKEEPEFRERLFDMASNVVVLQIDLRVKPKSAYFLQKEERDDPQSDELLAALRDSRAANVEVRKARADSRTVRLYRYYKDPGDTPSPVLELPRDSLGRLWDRLEENPVTSFLMHRLTRHFAWHVELFLTAEEFRTFWRTHAALPLRKIQLRYIRRDGFPKSPFRDHDCVSADLFMLRRHRKKFEKYLKQNFAALKTNPGKHSR